MAEKIILNFTMAHLHNDEESEFHLEHCDIIDKFTPAALDTVAVTPFYKNSTGQLDAAVKILRSSALSPTIQTIKGKMVHTLVGLSLGVAALEHDVTTDNSVDGQLLRRILDKYKGTSKKNIEGAANDVHNVVTDLGGPPYDDLVAKHHLDHWITALNALLSAYRNYVKDRHVEIGQLPKGAAKHARALYQHYCATYFERVNSQIFIGATVPIAVDGYAKAVQDLLDRYKIVANSPGHGHHSGGGGGSTPSTRSGDLALGRFDPSTGSGQASSATFSGGALSLSKCCGVGSRMSRGSLFRAEKVIERSRNDLTHDQALGRFDPSTGSGQASSATFSGGALSLSKCCGVGSRMSRGSLFRAEKVIERSRNDLTQDCSSDNVFIYSYTQSLKERLMSIINKYGRTLLVAAAVAAGSVWMSGCGGDKGSEPTAKEYSVTVSSAGSGALGGGSYAAGATVVISAGTAPAGQQFKNWTSSSSGVIFADPSNAATTFVMPANAVTVTAVFEQQGAATYAVTVTSAGTGATGNGSYAAGAAVNISAGTAPSGQRFANWTSASAGVSFADANSAATTFTMPANAVTVTANFEAESDTSGTPSAYTVTVSSAGTDATGGGSYEPGATVAISAGTAPDGQQFLKWTSTGGVRLGDSTRATTAFVMPANHVTVTAVFESSTFIDLRDVTTYKKVRIGGKMWMAENLKYETTTGSVCYGNDDANCEKYGRLYNWSTAMNGANASNKNPSGVQGICPDGWHLPSRPEWDALIAAAGGTVSGKALKSTSGWYNNGNGTDTYGFSALPGGGRISGNFIENGDRGYWWTSWDDNGAYSSSFYKRMDYDSDNVREDKTNKGTAYSVRCIAD